MVPGKTKPRNDNVTVVTATATECRSQRGSAEEAQVPVQTPDKGGSCALLSPPGHTLLHGKSFGKETLNDIVMILYPCFGGIF